MVRGAYNLHVYENLVFTVPKADFLRTSLLVAGFAFGLITYGLARVTLPFEGGYLALIGAVAAFTVPAFVTALATRRFPDFPPKWGYLLGLVITSIGFVSLAADLLLGPTVGWRILLFGAAAGLLTALAVLVLTAGTTQPAMLAVAASPIPLSLVALPAIAAQWYAVPGPDMTRAVMALATVGVGLAASVFVHERLIDANVTYIDGSRLTSTLLTQRVEDIDAGIPHEPVVQSLVIDRRDGRFTLAVPWVHPGPLANFGGGAVADRVINRLNEDGTGFFAKAPSTHQDDPAEGAIADRVLEALPDPATADRASRLVHREYEDISFHGRRYGEARIVLVEPHDFGDFPTSIIGDIIDPADTLIAERHAYEGSDRGIRYGSVEAERLRVALGQFLDDLDDTELHPYEAGWAVDTDGKQLCALVEAVDGQRTVLFGSNENEVSRTMQELETSLADQYDEAVVFSTDTHHDMHDLAVRRQVDPERMRRVVETADAGVAPASAGVDADRAAETRLLGHEYYALQYTINYVLRSFTVSLAVLYVMAAVVLAV